MRFASPPTPPGTLAAERFWGSEANCPCSAGTGRRITWGNWFLVVDCFFSNNQHLEVQYLRISRFWGPKDSIWRSKIERQSCFGESLVPGPLPGGPVSDVATDFGWFLDAFWEPKVVEKSCFLEHPLFNRKNTIALKSCSRLSKTRGWRGSGSIYEVSQSDQRRQKCAPNHRTNVIPKKHEIQKTLRIAGPSFWA